jgi:uncharacterized protein (DUF2345 family)
VLTIERRDDQALIRLLGEDGAQSLVIEVGPNGPVLRVGSGLAIAIEGELSLSAKRVDIHGREGVQLRSGGDTVLYSEGDLTSSAREHQLESRLGDVRLDANDDIKLTGERIRLNC